jgi:anti-sigma regulatory factor (Ser/Thr protein kinase)
MLAPMALQPGRSEPTTTGDRIRLVLPADGAYGRIARIAVSSLALRLGFGFDAAEDLRLAIDETIVLLLRPDGGRGELVVDFVIEPDALVIDAATVTDPGRRSDPAARARFEEIVAGIVDEHRVGDDDTTVHLVKSF